MSRTTAYNARDEIPRHKHTHTHTDMQAYKNKINLQRLREREPEKIIIKVRIAYKPDRTPGGESTVR